MSKKVYRKCPKCGKNKDTSKVNFYPTSSGEICGNCYDESIYEIFVDYLDGELDKNSIDHVVKVVTKDIGVLSYTHTRAYETGMRFVVKSALFSHDEEIRLYDLENYLNIEGNYKTSAEKVVTALLEADFLRETQKASVFLPGPQSINFAEKIRYGATEKEAVRQAYGLLNFTLMKNQRRHIMTLKAILATAQELLDKQKELGELTFDVHVSDFLRQAKNIGLNSVTMSNHVDKWIGLTPDGDSETTAFFDGASYDMGYNYEAGVSGFDYTLNMKKEWVQIRERLNSRMREVEL